MNGSRVVLIAAVARNGVIGRDNAIPWNLATDMKRFRAMTMGHPVIMGRRTFQSIGRPLPGRDNIVVSRHDFQADGVTCVGTLDEALALAAERAGVRGDVFVIGGSELYRETIGLADRLEITEVDAAPEGDAMFPAIDRDVWRIVNRSAPEQGAGDSAAMRFVTYDRFGSGPG